MIVSTTTASVFLWGLPAIDSMKADSNNRKMAEKFEDFHETVNQVISSGTSAYVTERMSIEEGSLEIDSEGDRLVTWYSYDPDWDFNVSGLEPGDGNKKDISIDITDSPGGAGCNKRDFYWLNETCFLAGTKVLMANGMSKNIEDIKPGDLVKSYDFDNKKMVDSEVAYHHEHLAEEMGGYYLVINNNLCVTPNHRFYTKNGLVQAGNLEVKDKIFSNVQGTYCPVSSIKKVYCPSKTYDLSIKNLNNYYVKSNDKFLLVHNAGVDIELTVEEDIELQNLEIDSYGSFIKFNINPLYELGEINIIDARLELYVKDKGGWEPVILVSGGGEKWTDSSDTEIIQGMIDPSQSSVKPISIERFDGEPKRWWQAAGIEDLIIEDYNAVSESCSLKIEHPGFPLDEINDYTNNELISIGSLAKSIFIRFLSQEVEPDFWPKLVVTYETGSSNNPPTTTIYDIPDQVEPTQLSIICGNASDTDGTIAGVYLNIHDDTEDLYWCGSSWSGTCSPLPSGCSMILSAMARDGSFNEEYEEWNYLSSSVSWTNGNQYTITAKAKDDDGDCDTDGASDTFVYVEGNSPPDTGVEDFPENAGPEHVSEITGTSLDTDGTVAGVYLRIYDRTNGNYWTGSGWNSFGGVVPGQCSYELSAVASDGNGFNSGDEDWLYDCEAEGVTWTSGHEYTVYAKAKDDDGACDTDGASDTFVYVEGNSPPDTGVEDFPENAGPEHVSEITGTSLDTDGTVAGVYLRIYDRTNGNYWTGSGWNSFGGVVPGQCSYELSAVASDGNGFNSGDEDWLYDCEAEGVTWTSGHEYTVYAKAKDDDGACDTDGASDTFVYVEGNSPPDTPSNPDPESDAVDESIDVELSWTASDPDSNYATSAVYFSDPAEPGDDESEAETINNLEDRINSDDNDQNTSSNSFDPGVLEYNKKYFWKIIVWDDKGLSTEGPIWNFTTESDPVVNNPPEITYHYPVNGSIDIPASPTCKVTVYDDDRDDVIRVVIKSKPEGGSWSDPQYDSTHSSGDTISWDYTSADGSSGVFTYYWLVTLTDPNDESISIEEVYHFTISLDPIVTDISEPWDISMDYLSYYNDTDYDFYASASTPHNFDIYFNFSWGDGTSSGWLLESAVSPGSCSATHQWLNAGVYPVKVQVASDPDDDGHGGTGNSDDAFYSGWTDPVFIKIENTVMVPCDIAIDEAGNPKLHSDAGSGNVPYNLEGIVRIDLYSNDYPDSSDYGSDVSGRIPFGQIWIFDLGKITQTYRGAEDIYKTIFENGGIISSKSEYHSMTENSNIYNYSSYLVFKLNLVRGINSISGSGSGIFKLKLKINNSYIRNEQNRMSSNLKVQMFGDYKEVWYDFLTSPLRSYNFQEYSSNSDILLYDEGRSTRLILSSNVLIASISGVL